MGGVSFVVVSDVFDGLWFVIIKSCFYYGILVVEMISFRDLLRLGDIIFWIIVLGKIF